MKWITAKTKPKKDGKYLVSFESCSSKKPVWMAYWGKERDHWKREWIPIGQWNAKVSHWAKLPKGPK